MLLEQICKENDIKNINKEDWNALAEEIRQYNESIALEREQFEWQKSNFKKSSGGGGGGGSSRSSGGSSSSSSSNKIEKSSGSGSSAADQLNAAIAAGATKDKVANAISNAVKNGTISKSEATSLRQTFTPRGYTY